MVVCSSTSHPSHSLRGHIFYVAPVNHPRQFSLSIVEIDVKMIEYSGILCLFVGRSTPVAKIKHHEKGYLSTLAPPTADRRSVFKFAKIDANTTRI